MVLEFLDQLGPLGTKLPTLEGPLSKAVATFDGRTEGGPAED
jgi:hypothetical protein